MAQHLGDADARVSWGNLKQWARDNKVPDEALIEVSGYAVKDLDLYDAEGGQLPLFTFIPGQRMYH